MLVRTEDILPIIESGPYTCNKLFNIIKELDPDNDLNIARGNISLGNIFILIKDIISFKILLLINTEIHKDIANIDGNSLNDIS